MNNSTDNGMSWASTSIYGSALLEKEKACRINYDNYDDDDCNGDNDGDDDDDDDDNDDAHDDYDDANKMS